MKNYINGYHPQKGTLFTLEQSWIKTATVLNSKINSNNNRNSNINRNRYNDRNRDMTSVRIFTIMQTIWQ